MRFTTVLLFVFLSGGFFAFGYFLGSERAENDSSTSSKMPTQTLVTAVPSEVETQASLPEAQIENPLPTTTVPKRFESAFVSLRSTDGRMIKAELVELDGQQLTIRREDGQAFSFGIEMLVASDRENVRQFFVDGVAEEGYEGDEGLVEDSFPVALRFLNEFYRDLSL